MALEKNLSLWAVVEDGVIMATGPLPYFAVDQSTGQRVQVKGAYDPMIEAHEDELASRFNLYAMYDKDLHAGDMDPDLESEIEPTDYIDSDGKPVRKHNYDLNDGVRAMMIEKVNAKAERERIRIAASFGGQMREYLETEEEALRFLALPTQQRQSANPDNWPYLKAGIGNDIVSGGGVAMSLEQVALVVKQRSVEWRTALANIRQVRKDTLGRIEMAASDQVALDIYYQAFGIHNEAMFGSHETKNYI